MGCGVGDPPNANKLKKKIIIIYSAHILLYCYLINGIEKNIELINNFV